jgi:hypothetical protein
MSLAVDPVSRQTEIIIPFIEYEWWLMRWSNNSYECQLLVDHEGMPSPNDLFVQCGDSLYQEWLDTKTCDPALTGDKTSTCSGLYLHQIAFEAKEKVVLVDLPLPEAWVSISGCSPIPPGNQCETLPNLLITAEEPLPNETITHIQGTYNGIPFVCVGDFCEVPLRPTLIDGVEIRFWADSSFGDSSQQFEAHVRVTDSGVAEGPEKGGWIVELMSERLEGYHTLGCGPMWNSFPPIGNLPGWLKSPDSPELLASNDPYMYLAGRLIDQDFVDASDCLGGGVELNGYANTCGLERARSVVDVWQNRFDSRIVDVSQESGVPSQLLKNLFAQESQFWPGVFNDADEFGLGHLTELGADTILLWSPSFYNQFCPLILNIDTCNQGYPQLSENDQAILRGAVAIRANSDCSSCPTGIDLNHAIYSIELFAQTILANCQQAGQIVTNNRGELPGSVARYEDLWRFTLANYHAGPGCLSNAIQSLASRPLTWENLAPRLERECPGIEDYIDGITK